MNSRADVSSKKDEIPDLGLEDATSDHVGSAESLTSSGVRIRVEVCGHEDAGRLARRALVPAQNEIVKRMTLGEPKVEMAAHGIVGTSEPMKNLFRLLERIRSSDATVLITGENGTGKELVARAIHQQSKRASRAFVATNCSAFNDNLLESELFGHKKGAFTGAISDKPGLFEMADQGTFFMDEVGDMSPALQVKLLRVLQEGVILPVGATEQRRVQVRIVAATNRNLTQMVSDGSFREDLYYRLHVVALRVPPLRERLDDIPLLVEHFLMKLSNRDGQTKVLAEETMQRLKQHHWPGNIRELENEIERLWVLAGEHAVLEASLLSPSIGQSKGSAWLSGPQINWDAETTLPQAIENLERSMIERTLAAERGNKTRAADILGISRRNLIRKVQSFGLEDSRTGSGKATK